MTLSLGSHRYRLLSEHFQACSDLSAEERESYLAGPSIADDELREELRSLLKFHSANLEIPTPRPPVHPAATKPQDSQVRKSRRRRVTATVLVAGLTATVIGLVAGVWALSQLNTELRGEAVDDLMRSVDDRASAVRVWAERQKILARTVLQDPELAEHVARLAEVADASRVDADQLKSSPSYAKVLAHMSRVPEQISGCGFIVLSPAGVGLCSEPEAMIGRPVSAAGAGYLRRCALGEWIITRPYPSQQFGAGLTPDYSRPRMFVGGPIHDAAGKLVGIGGFRFDPRREFFGLLPQHPGIRTLAFDERGLILNECGDADRARQAGLIPPDPGNESGLMRLRLRDPEVELTPGRRPEAAPETWEPTLMARRAIEGGRGSSAREYRDFLGRPVLGAWTWLPEWEMGLGAEQDLGWALAPMKTLRVSLSLVLIAPVLAMALLVAVLRLRPLTAGRDSDFGSYRLEYSLGKGGSAEVFLARHEVLKRPAAVKILNTQSPDAATVANFEREARLASSLGHPNTIQIFDYGETPQGKLYYAMEYVKGVNLAQLLAIEGPLPVARALYLLRQVAGALEEAHTMGLVHRDLKPSNVMICSRGALGDVVKVLDFGIARPSSSAHEDFTGSAELVGTPVYMAPERIRVPSGLDPRSDVYSFGALGFHLLTGRNVFEGPGPTELIYQVLTADRPSPSRFRGEALPEALERLILECLSIDPEERPATFKEVMRRLAAVPAPGRWSQDEARDWWATNRDRLVAFIESVEIARRGA